MVFNAPPASTRPGGGGAKTLYEFLGWLQDPTDIQLKARVDNPQRRAAMELVTFYLAGESPKGTLTQNAMLKRQRKYVGLNADEIDEDYLASEADFFGFYVTSEDIASVAYGGLARVETVKAGIGSSGGPYDKIMAAELATTKALTT